MDPSSVATSTLALVFVGTEIQTISTPGSELDLSCVATSTPAPSYRWYRNAIILGENINTNIDGGSLTVSNVNSMNKGVYQCEAFNEQGCTISSSMYIHILMYSLLYIYIYVIKV